MAINLLRTRRLALLASSSLLAASPALADAPPAAAPEATNSSEIVVTATKRSENLQNVPISIVAMSNTTLTQHQVSSFDDYAKMMPSVSYQSFGPGQTQLNFRGITNGGDGIALGPLPTAGLYINETPVTTVYGAVDMHVYDMDHVEALSGPQGTLYGASSLAGTLRLITAAPKIGRWEGGMDVEGNKFGPGAAGGKLEGYVNIPIGDRAALRVVGFYEHDGGYISNSPATRTYVATDFNGNNNPITINNAPYVKKNFNTVDQVGGRAALKVNLDDNWTATPMVIYQHQIALGTYLYNDPANPNYSQGYDAGWGSMQVHDFAPDHNRDAWYLASMTLQGKVSNWDVTYNGSYFGRQADTVADYSYFTAVYDSYQIPGYTYFTDSTGKQLDPTQTFHQHDTYTKMSQEARISTPATNPLRLTAGLYWQRQTDAHTADYIVNGLSTSQQYYADDWYLAGAPANDVYYTDLYRVDRDYAAYAEGSFDPGNGLTITAGIRVFKYNNSLGGFSGGSSTLAYVAGVNNCGASPTVQNCPNVSKDATGTGETHKISANWKVAPGKMFYATYSTGFRPGGNNRDVYYQPAGQATPDVQVNGPFKADTLNNYEIGWKTSWFDRKVYFDGALFLENWNNMQYSQPGYLGIYYTLNAGTARSQGVEASLTWRPVHGLSLSSNATYLDAKLTSNFICEQANCGSNSEGYVIAPSGTRLPITPHFKANATARYDWMVGDHKLFMQAGLNHQSNTTSYLPTAGEAALGQTNGFTTVDFSAGFTQGSWSMTAYINNAFNEMGVLSKNSECAPSLCGAQARLYPTKPQEFGLKAGYKF